MRNHRTARRSNSSASDYRNCERQVYGARIGARDGALLVTGLDTSLPPALAVMTHSRTAPGDRSATAPPAAKNAAPRQTLPECGAVSAKAGDAHFFVDTRVMTPFRSVAWGGGCGLNCGLGRGCGSRGRGRLWTASVASTAARVCSRRGGRRRGAPRGCGRWPGTRRRGAEAVRRRGRGVLGAGPIRGRGARSGSIAAAASEARRRRGGRGPGGRPRAQPLRSSVGRAGGRPARTGVGRREVGPPRTPWTGTTSPHPPSCA